MPASADQISKVQAEWKSVDQEGDGVQIFQKFFAAHGDYQGMFEAFKGADKNALGGNAKAKAHIKVVMGQLGKIIGSMGTGECDGLLTAMAGTHKPRQVGGGKIRDLNKVILSYFAGKVDAGAWSAVLEDLAAGIDSRQ